MFGWLSRYGRRELFVKSIKPELPFF